MRVVAIGAAHGPFENLVMRRHRELVFDFSVTTQAELGLADLQQLDRREVRLFGVCRRDESVRARDVPAGDRAV